MDLNKECIHLPGYHVKYQTSPIDGVYKYVCVCVCVCVCACACVWVCLCVYECV